MKFTFQKVKEFKLKVEKRIWMEFYYEIKTTFCLFGAQKCQNMNLNPNPSWNVHCDNSNDEKSTLGIEFFPTLILKQCLCEAI